MPYVTKYGTHYHENPGCAAIAGRQVMSIANVGRLAPCALCCGTGADAATGTGAAEGAGATAGTGADADSARQGAGDAAGRRTADGPNPLAAAPPGPQGMPPALGAAEIAQLLADVSGRDPERHGREAIAGIVAAAFPGDEEAGLMAVAVALLRDRQESERENLRLRQALSTMRREAMRDDLTGVKNGAAWRKQKEAIDMAIKSGMSRPFAIVSFDLNGLKAINDSKNHEYGSRMIQAASRDICEVFKHSPVFHPSGDEFVVLLTGSDYEARDDLVRAFRDRSLAYMDENAEEGVLVDEHRPVTACGYAVYMPGIDLTASDVFARADDAMYEDKRSVKARMGLDPDQRF